MCERELGWEAEQSIPGKPAALGGVFKHTGEIVPSSRRASANFCSPCKDFSLGLACVRRPWFSKGLRRCPCLRASLQSLTREHGVNWFLGLCICCLMSTNTHFYFFFLPPYGMLWFQSNTGLQTQTCQSYDCGCIDGEYALLLERLHLSATQEHHVLPWSSCSLTTSGLTESLHVLLISISIFHTSISKSSCLN